MFKKLKSNPNYKYMILFLLFLGIALPDFGQFQVSSLADKLREGDADSITLNRLQRLLEE